MPLSRRTILLSSSAGLGAVLLGACSSQQEETGSTTAESPTPEATPTPTPEPTPTYEMTVWEDNTTVPHLFFHSLVVDTDRAFDGDEDAAGYLDYMATMDEFETFLQHVYDRGYVLVSPHDIYDVAPGGAVVSKPLEVPVGKTPLVLSFDDLSYYEYMEGDGFADNVALDDDDQVTTTYTDAAGKTEQGEFDYVPVLDRFVADHPDFSPHGRKGVIAMTGYNGVLGYRTSDLGYRDENPDLEQDKQTATEVADAMKADGWEFSCHTWGHLNCTEMPVGTLQEDMGKWKAEVEPIIGKTDLLIYPFGADIAGPEPYTDANPKFAFFKAEGFNSFFNVDASTPAWNQYGDRYLRQARINVDGISLKAAIEGKNDVLHGFFDPHAVVDPARPASIAGS
ncbi:polysaccharide deacetylase family protein [Rothia sp. AR01]|uniref:Polysaccharide deacetylase family protein n=1 Tax=Rothia santali TaxID=2949643 RepID=A0A9X2HIR0_9MICC|nr:polysaccharide deacetylase family protein [Rothia santali]